jgi:hypothetical protein
MAPFGGPGRTGAAVWRAAAVGVVFAIVAGCSASPRRASRAPSVGLASSGPTPAGLVLAVDDAFRFRIEDLTTGTTLRPLSLTPARGGLPRMASAPGGWVVTYTPETAPAADRATSRLAVVDTAGTVTPFGPTLPANTPVTGLAVSPDGTRVGLALMQTTAADARASIVVLAMPGHEAAARSWPVDNPNVNEMISLSWAPDSTHLSYIAGSQTGAGIGGDPSTLDTAGNATEAPTAVAWGPSTGQCDPDGAVWLGTTGRFATVIDCPPSGTYTEVNPETGATTVAPLTLPNYACLIANIHPSADGTRVLISRCNRVDLVAGGTVAELDPHLTDAAWAGN